MRQNHLVAEVRHYCRTTWSRHGYRRYPNRLRGLAIERPNQVWAADLTYIRVRQGFVYLAVLLDLFSRAIRGWALSRHLTEDLPLAALAQALARAQPEIHHSDQGAQYLATRYVACLTDHQVRLSNAAPGQPTENAFVERLFRTLKEEEVTLHEYQDEPDARGHIEHFLNEVYMHKRVHSALGYLPPAEFEMQYYQSHALVLKA